MELVKIDNENCDRWNMGTNLFSHFVDSLSFIFKVSQIILKSDVENVTKKLKLSSFFDERLQKMNELNL